MERIASPKKSSTDATTYHHQRGSTDPFDLTIGYDFALPHCLTPLQSFSKSVIPIRRCQSVPGVSWSCADIPASNPVAYNHASWRTSAGMPATLGRPSFANRCVPEQEWHALGWFVRFQTRRRSCLRSGSQQWRHTSWALLRFDPGPSDPFSIGRITGRENSQCMCPETRVSFAYADEPYLTWALFRQHFDGLYESFQACWCRAALKTRISILYCSTIFRDLTATS